MEMSGKPAFQFDLNKCVGCQACVVACILENNTEPQHHWRTIYSFNSLHKSNLPIYHFSLACNHCTHAPCMHNCPALAYTRDMLTGAVVHTADHCIGCKYCTWACPYDAPKYNPVKGIIEKCTFCNDKLKAGQKPACVSHCPTGALDITQRENVTSYPLALGFDHHYIEPAIKLIPPRGNHPEVFPVSIDIPTLLTENKDESKISFAKEWPLWIFTNLIAILFGNAYSTWQAQSVLPNYISIIIILLSVFFSTMHLGKKTRAWRAILNIRRSWLSREIASFGAFAATWLSFIIFPQYIPAILPVILGFVLLFSADMIYSIAQYPTRLKIHSAQITFTGIAYATLFTAHYDAFVFILGIKFAIFIFNKLAMRKDKRNIDPLFTGIRVLFGFILPLLLIYLQINAYVLYTIYILGEITDRYMYYNELSLHTPQTSILRAEETT